MNERLGTSGVGRRVRCLVFCVSAVSLFLLTPIGPASAEPGNIILVSTSDTGVISNAGGGSPALSSDGTRVAFQSLATNLDPGDKDAVYDVYVKDLVIGDVTLVSTSDAGVKGNGHSYFAAISDDGMRVAFQSDATNLDPGDTDASHDVYVKDLVTGDITLASTSDTGVKGNDFSRDVALSGDGTVVGFWSQASNLDPGDGGVLPDVYVKDLATGDLTLVSTSDTGEHGNSNSYDVALSDDGTRVAFWSYATNLDPSDTDTIADVYVKNLVNGNITLASTSDTGVKGAAHSYGVVLSDDGMRVAFVSDATNLDPGDTDSLADIYVKDLTTGDITLASTSDAGAKGNESSINVALSGDGTRVAFDSEATNLHARDTDATPDVYVKDLVTDELTLASTSDTGVKGNGSSSNVALSGDGTRAGFQSGATNLDPGDSFNTDIYVKTGDIVCDDEAVTIQGTAQADIIVGTPGRDVIDGGSGADTISGLGGNDVICGGSGADDVTGGAGDDILSGGGGDDAMTGGAGSDTLTGLAGNDTMTGGDGEDTLTGGAGHDTLTGGVGSDTLVGGDGGDTAAGNSGDDVLTGGSGNDSLEGGRGTDILSGISGADDLEGGSGADTLMGGTGVDTLKGGTGKDALKGGAGNDTLKGGDGVDTCDGGGGVDTAGPACETQTGIP